MELLELNNEFEPARVDEWIESLGDTETPLDDEDEVKVGMTTLDVQHLIDTQGAAPIMLKHRRQAQSEEDIIDENVSAMLQAGVIKEGNRSWGFPVVLLRKKDGEVCFCIAYRALNNVTKRDVYPLPRIDETVEALSGAQFFSTLGLRDGYWQIGVTPDDRDKTAFYD
ncbi:unnamed protein product [Phytophthora fragariaefolia]|uniref:Unnamed protein product n=1 Tax=Phytophthora fragariaefolia TaxID=1490495 RepID=A0A9W6Y9Q3_9STRA|nr:unnamed protein product [Phytophthora fragariaefolia]